MIRRLQTFAFNRSPYERPNQKWVCGRAAEGCPCRIGPDRRGRCRAGAECSPRSDGTRWVCTRPQSAGGACPEGACPDGSCARPIPPCQPVRSIRAKRGLVARWALAVTVGLMAVTVFGTNAAGWLSPGTLSAPHSQIGDCAGCHQDFEGGPGAWLHAAFAESAPAAESDSGLCLSCHEAGSQPLEPHGVPAARLTRAGGEGGSANGPIDLELAAGLMSSPHQSEGGLACATCHAEHEGRAADLTAMGDGRCQSCHERKFASLNVGHPEFGAYPHERRTRIRFNHVSHADRHFADADAGAAPERCTGCHQPGEASREMQVSGFERACAACHAGEVRGENAAGATGIPVIVVPGLDVPSLRANDIGIGHWPELADRELTPFMRTIFAADPALADALARFEKLDPFDLREASAADLEAVKRIAWATKRLLHDLLADGPAALRPALADAMGREVGHASARDLLGGMSLDAVRRAQSEWFPDLAAELARHRAGERVPIPGGQDADEGQSATADDPDATESDGDILDNEAGANEGILGGGNGDGDADGGTGSDDDSILGGEDSGGGDDILGGEESSGGDSILGGDEDDSGESILGDEGDGSGGGDGGDSILGGESDSSDGDLLGGGGDEPEEPEVSAAADAELPDPDPADWGQLGGWYRDFYALLYRPSGHADRFLKGWLDLSGRAMAGGGRAGAEAIFQHLGRSDGPGRCTKCHSVDAVGDGEMRINWAARTPDPDRQAFTRFSHGPHFTLLTDDEGCATCHAFNRDSDYAASFEDRDPGTYHSNFKPIDRDTCGDCHNDRQAGNDCTQCHNYHVGRVTSAATRTRIERMESVAPE
ncbi:cytochrome c3 family protein [Halofilum ochraceum]|uniref:cytochrome c3 family protein n=1 Tax=Halofilum ochraceum TaxID=1611323 RepID=UPI0008DA0A6D|nr:cytochrome c3 family protein [Halofilum ochraceum]